MTRLRDCGVISMYNLLYKELYMLNYMFIDISVFVLLCFYSFGWLCYGLFLTVLIFWLLVLNVWPENKLISL